jgi:hypothetical protein
VRSRTLALLAGVIVSARADTYLNCSDFHQTFGYAGTNPPVTARVTHLDYGRWTVTYYLRNGEVVFRENQLVMSDKTDRTKTQWSGWRGNKQMVGMLVNDNSNGHIVYVDYLYDINNRLLSSNWIDCGVDDSAPPKEKPPTYEANVPSPTPRYEAPPTPRYDPPTASGSSIDANEDAVALSPAAFGGVQLTVNIGGHDVAMLLDTGASITSVSQELAEQML